MSKRKSMASAVEETKEKKAKTEVSTLMFYSESKDVKAGCGAKETLAVGDSFVELDKIKGWRKVLSAFYAAEKPIELNGRRFVTMEHAHHASKFWKTAPEFAKLFEVGSAALPHAFLFIL
jgi:hypothetical protein